MLTKGDLQEIDKVLTKRMKAELKPVKDDVSHMRKDIKTIVNFFDREYLDLRKRVERIEEHLHLTPSF